MNLHRIEAPKQAGARIALESILAFDQSPLLWTPKLLDKPSAWWSHVPFAFWITAVCKPRVVVELGTHYGVSYAAFCEAILRLRLTTRSYAVDSWAGDPQTGFYGDEVFGPLSSFHDLNFSAFSELLRMQFDEANQRFTDGTIDLLHLDGYHTYEAVSHDFNLWLPKLSNRGVVLFHDTNVHRDDFGVWRFFEELSRTTPCFEFLHGCGLGVACVGAEAPDVVQELCRLDDDAVAAVRERFSQSGAVWVSANEALLEGQRHLERIQNLERDLDEKTRAIGCLEAEQEELNGRLDAGRHDFEALEKTKNELAWTVADKDRLIAERGAQLGEYRSIIAERDRLIGEREAQLAKKDTVIANKEIMIAEREAQAEVMFSALAQKDALIAKTRAMISDKQAALEAALAGQSKHADQLMRAERIIAYASEKFAKARKKNVFRRLRYSLTLAFKGKPVRTSQYFRIRNSVFFDKNFYLGANSDIKASGLDPVVHYLLHGAAEGRDPGPYFSETQYRAQHQDVAENAPCALEHYEWRGREEGRRLLGGFNRAVTTGRTVLGNALQLLSTSPLPPPRLSGPVDIIIPAYNCLPYLDPLFESLARNTTRPHRVIVVDNGNTDPRMRERLKSFVESYENAVLIRLDPNQGFVGAVNRAAEIAEHDFVLLNTDVVVPPHWLERLMAPLSADRGIASVTPFSNAATTCSFPRFCEDNDIYGGLSVEAIDRWFSRVHVEKIRQELPSGVGFCMAVNRGIWKEIGPFDEEVFRKGYGEENDWCLRAQARGYGNIIAPNLFVYHKHGGTFESESRAQLLQASLDEVNRRYPAYDGAVRKYIETDTLRPLREMLAAIIACNEADVRPIVIIDHQMGGGANQYRNTIVRERKESRQPVLTFLIKGGSVSKQNNYELEFRYLDYFEAFDVQGEQDIVSLLSFVKPEEIFLNNLVGAPSPSRLLDHLLGFKRLSNAKLVIAVHDYYCLCPSYTLLNAQDKYCGIPDISVCDVCLRGSRFAKNPERLSQHEWRRHWRRVLEAANEVLCFSEDTKRKIAQVFPQASEKLVVRPHELTVKFHERLILEGRGPLHIGVVGAIGPEKGSNVVNRLALHMLENDPAARITVIGQMHERADASNLRVTGPYEQAELPKLLLQSGVDVCLLPSIWPETFSYVASELMALGVPLAVFDLGAPAERVRQYAAGKVLDCELIDDPAGLHQALTTFHRRLGDLALTAAPIASGELSPGAGSRDAQVTSLGEASLDEDLSVAVPLDSGRVAETGVHGAEVASLDEDLSVAVPLDSDRVAETGVHGAEVAPLDEDLSVAVPLDYDLRGAKRLPRIAVIIHMFEVTLTEEILDFVKNIPYPFDVFISTDNDDKKAYIQDRIRLFDAAVEIRVTPRRGRDIAPRLIGFRDVYDRYEYVLLLHSKVSFHNQNLEKWRDHLFKHLVGSPAVVESIFELFTQLPQLGIVAAQHFEPVREFLGWGEDFQYCYRLAGRFGANLRIDGFLDYPSGSMLWARSAALRPFFDAHLTLGDFPPDIAGSQIDGTMAHAVERLFFVAAEKAGLSWIKIAQPEFFEQRSTIKRISRPSELREFLLQHERRLACHRGCSPAVVTHAGYK